MQASWMLPSLLALKADVGQAIRRLRTQTTEYSQESLGKVVDRHRTFIGLIERGKANPSLETLYQIAAALGVSVADLFILAMSQAKGPVAAPFRRVAEPRGDVLRMKKRGK